jgi:endo-1,4-beta-mannosidase
MTTQWSTGKAWNWHQQQGWRVGCNFTPSTAINQLEMWQADTFDPTIIQRELGWASAIGLNTVRVYLHDLLWLFDRSGLVTRRQRYLEIAAAQHIKTVFVFFDDCWNVESAPGKQPAPRPGVHNSGWVQSPGSKVVNDPTQWSRLEDYVCEMLNQFGTDERILMWDLYNEPGNSQQGERSLGLLQAVFGWARSVAIDQPISVGWWSDFPTLNAYQFANSDIITFHNYNDADSLRTQIEALKALGRPMLCTEYMARPRGSRFETHLPIFKENGVGCVNWGLVAGKTQTNYPWGSAENSAEPEVWFHEIFHADGSPYIQAEVDAIKKATGK